MGINWGVFKSIAIIGGTGSGKTSLMYKVLESFKKTIYFYKHPKFHLIKPLGFKQLHGLGQLEAIRDCVVVVDEPQLYDELNGSKNIQMLRRLFSLCRQRKITIIIVTSDSRYFNRSIEEYIDAWCVKDLDFHGLKQGGMPKRIVKRSVFISVEGFRLKQSEFLFYSRFQLDWSGKHLFNESLSFSSELSNAYDIDCELGDSGINSENNSENNVNNIIMEEEL